MNWSNITKYDVSWSYLPLTPPPPESPMAQAIPVSRLLLQTKYCLQNMWISFNLSDSVFGVVTTIIILKHFPENNISKLKLFQYVLGKIF